MFARNHVKWSSINLCAELWEANEQSRPHRHLQSIHNTHDGCIDRGQSHERDAMVEEALLSGHHKQLGDSVAEDGEWEESVRSIFLTKLYRHHIEI